MLDSSREEQVCVRNFLPMTSTFSRGRRLRILAHLRKKASKRAVSEAKSAQTVETVAVLTVKGTCNPLRMSSSVELILPMRL
jgi:hypothetical protein